MVRCLVCSMLVALVPPGAAAGRDVPRASVPREATMLTLTIRDNCLASSAVLETTRSEAARIWSDAGVRLRWVAPDKVPYAAPRSEWMVVTCDTREMTQPTRGSPFTLPIAAIRFIASAPTNTILLDLENARQALRDDPHERAHLQKRPGSVRDVRLGRIVGRSIAHEIGHFVLRSTDHAPEGLMKARHSVRALAGDSLAPFTVGLPARPALAARPAPAAPSDPTAGMCMLCSD